MPLRHAPKRIAIFGLPFSPNLGDVLVAECIRKELLTHFPDAVIENFDVSGRQKPHSPARLLLRRAILKVLVFLPKRMRSPLVLIFTRMRIYLNPRWRTMEFLSDCDFAVIGGGQLFRDNNLFMPVLLNHLCRRLNYYQKPFSIFSCGVTPGWSDTGKRLFLEVLNNPGNLLTAVRDDLSYQSLLEIWGPQPMKNVMIAPDPAFLCPNNETRGAAHRRTVGFGLISPLILQYYGDHWDKLELKDFKKHCVSVALTMLREGYHVVLFSDGSPEDQSFARWVYSKILNSSDDIDVRRVTLSPRCSNTEDLIGWIRSMDLAIAYRMHAHIIAFTQGVPSLILGWDSKLEGFVRLTDSMSRYIVEHNPAPCSVASLASDAMAEKRDDTLRRTVVDNTRSAFEKLASVLGNSMRSASTWSQSCKRW
jgi:polysaccharide pyruvyl transferase WcaK-like protein